jgi:hypothetical protein
VSVTCGDVELTGAIFATGIKLALSLLENDRKLERSVPPVLTFMDKSSGELQLLPKLANLQTTSAVPSFKVLPLGDLLRMFQDHEATDQRDKIYALLGLSSDNDLSPDLRPDYTKTWSTLFRQVIVHVIGASPTIRTWDNMEKALISSLGCVLGTISVGIANTISVISPLFGGVGGAGYLWRASWQVPHHSGSVRDGDFLCFLQDARRPSIIRTCGDHFDIVMISLPPPPIVIIEKNPKTENWKDEKVDWFDFIPCVRHSSRQFTLVWDWATGRHDQQSHNALFSSEDGSDSMGPERRFNTARVLDDILDYTGMTELLKTRPVSNNPVPIEKHFILLDHMCAHWDAYVMMKRYLTIIRWGVWCLNAPINLDCLLDYWGHEGCLGLDLYDILRLAETGQERETLLPSSYMSYQWTFEYFQDDLYPILFPKYQPTMMLGRYRHYQQQKLSPHNGRYLMRLVLSSERPLRQPSGTILDRLYKDPLLSDQYHFHMALLSEHKWTSLDVAHSVMLAIRGIEGISDYRLLNFLLCEVAHSPIETHHLLMALTEIVELQDHNLTDIAKGLILPNMDKIIRYINNLALCELEFTLWTIGDGRCISTLQFLYSKFLIPLKSDYHPGTWQLSTHKTAKLYSVKYLARWAQLCILDAIDDYESMNFS